MKRTLPPLALVMLVAGCTTTPNALRALPPGGTYTLAPTVKPACECIARHYKETMNFPVQGFFDSEIFRTADECEIISSTHNIGTTMVTLVTERPDGSVAVAVHFPKHATTYMGKALEAAAMCGTVS